MRSPRPFKNKLLPLLLVLAAHKAGAQLAPADDFFNSGAQFYISNNVAAAKERVESGLKIYPEDAKLKRLEELLKQQQQSQSSQSQQNQQQQQQQSQQDSQDQKNQQQQQSQSQNSQDQKKSEQEKQGAAGQKKAEEKKEAEQKGSAAEKKDEEKKDGEGQAVAPGQMTPDEAKRLLDAQKGNEQLLQLKPRGKPENATRKIKDW